MINMYIKTYKPKEIDIPRLFEMQDFNSNFLLKTDTQFLFNE
jgi:hypothetical protein